MLDGVPFPVAGEAAAAGQLWLPTLVGLALIPAMPIVDEPLHHAMSFVFGRVWPEAKATQAAQTIAAKKHA